MFVKTVYFDMDGVLSDLDGAVASHFDLSREEVANGERRNRLHLLRIADLGIQKASTSLTTLRLYEMRALMRALHEKGCQLEILTSYGVQPIPGHDILEVGVSTHIGKAMWLRAHYGDLFDSQVIKRFNGVSNCEQKAHFATSNSLLIDDQLPNIRGFRQKGGRAVHYETWRHDECVAEIWGTLK